MVPKKPSRLDPITASLLDLATEKVWAGRLVLGGGVAFAHYLEYRATVDADFWWKENVPTAEKNETIAELEKLVRAAAEPYHRELSVSTRRWGDTVSVDVNSGGQRVYSCQIAERTTKLFPYLASPFGQIQIETWEENLGSKMNALVGRGSARDFLDIHTAIKAGLIRWQRCWQLWRAKNRGVNAQQAMRQVALHLQGIERRRPLAQVAEPERAQARELREFFRAHLAELLDERERDAP